MSDMMVDLASTEAAAPVSTTTDSSAVDTSSSATTPTNNDSTELAVIDASSEQPAEDSAEGTETESHKADGTERTSEEREAYKTEQAAKTTGKDVLPTEARAGLKALKELDNGKYSKVVQQLHGHYERWEAAKPLLGVGDGSGIVGLKSLLSAHGVATLPELSQALVNQHEMINSVSESDELLYAADPKIWQNVIEDTTAAGHPEALGKLAGSFVETLKEHDPESFYANVAKPLTLQGMDEAGLPSALNNLHQALVAGDMNSAKAITKAIAKFYTDLRDETGEKAKISKERQAWEAERAEATKGETAKAAREYETSVSTDAEHINNTMLGKSLGGFLRLPFFKDFPRETMIDLGNGIKEHLYATLKADKTYQSSMATMWKQKPTPENRAQMLAAHQAKLTEISDRVVREVVQKRYPGYARGGSAAGRVASAAASKANTTRAAAQSISTMKPIYVAARPDGLIRDSVKVGGKTYDANALQTLQITGRGFVRSSDGRSLRFVTWRKS